MEPTRRIPKAHPQVSLFVVIQTVAFEHVNHGKNRDGKKQKKSEGGDREKIVGINKQP